ncbi:MAG TPA: hypothetical protein PK504_08265 [Ferruginibacter sp.]|nr:hypothetical protein [Ferruginibacter sp.]HRE64768.1 hypothetical protein [Ferruginibacter sp.]
MKNILLLLLLFISIQIKSQVVIEPNPSYTNSSEKPVLNEWLDVESLDGRTEPTQPNPSEKICFDKKMLVKARVPQGTGYTCIFVNTKIGLVGYTPFTKNFPSCELDVSDPDFNFNIIGLKGTHFNYYNSVRKGELRHHLVTNNTHRQGLVFSAVGSNEPIYKKDAQREFFGKVKAWEYKANGRTESWWIFGKTIPDKLVMQPNKYLGIFGVGYQFAEQGMFIILQLSGSSTYGYEAEVLELKDIPTCFNSTLFRIVEENEMEEAVTNLQQGQERIDRQIEENSASNNPCKSYKEKVLKQNKKVAEITKNMVQSMQQGRRSQSLQLQVEREIETQQSAVDGYQEALCRKDVQISNAHIESSVQRLQQERRCIEKNKEFDLQMLGRFRSFQEAHRNDPIKLLQLMANARKQYRREPCRN